MTAWAHLNSGLLGRGAGKILRNRVVVGAVVLLIAIGAQCITSHYYGARVRRDRNSRDSGRAPASTDVTTEETKSVQIHSLRDSLHVMDETDSTVLLWISFSISMAR